MKKIPLEYLRLTCSSLNAIYFLHKILHTFCFKSIKGQLLVLREIENKAHATVLWRNNLRYGQRKCRKVKNNNKRYNRLDIFTNLRKCLEKN